MYYVGLMSGTSMDGADAVVVRFGGNNQAELIASHSHDMPRPLQEQLLEVGQSNARVPLSNQGLIEQELGQWFAEASLAVIKQAGLTARDITAIGCHGQTVRHEPDADLPFSTQWVSASRLAAVTGCTTVTDFRNNDMAVGGQGAPLAPAFHKSALQTSAKNRAVVNIGGIANVTFLPADASQSVLGFDTGPGNGLMDSWILKYTGHSFDANGQWAAGGTVQLPLLNALLTDSYFAAKPPKSTGREVFNLAWLEPHLQQFEGAISAQDVQATLCQLTAQTIAEHIKAYGYGNEEVLVCGGGVHNQYLMQLLQSQLAGQTVTSTQVAGVHPDWMEAIAFAWLAKQRIERLPGNLPAVTGAKMPVVLGAVHLPPPRAYSL